MPQQQPQRRCSAGLRLPLVCVFLCAFPAAVADHWSIGQLGNHNPSFFPGRPLVFAKEDCDTWQDEWATRVTDGDGQDNKNFYDSYRQNLRFEVKAERPGLFEIQPDMTDGRGPICPVPRPDPNDPYTIPGKPECTRQDQANDRGGISRLTFKCKKDECGCSTVSAQLVDSGVIDCQVGGNGPITAPTRIPFCPGGCSPDDCSKSSEHWFTICITCINDCPSFESVCDVKVNEDDQNVEILNWAFNVNKGAPNEDDQSIRFEVTTSNPALFKQQPYLVWDNAFPTVASLKFEPAKDRFGTSEICVTIFDDGGVANGGCDSGNQDHGSQGMNTEHMVCCQIEVLSVNDCPTYTANGQQDGGTGTPNGEAVTVQEDAGRVRIPRWASNISPGSDFGESSQNLWFNVVFADATQRALFDELPHIDPHTGDLVFRLKPDVNSLGSTFDFFVQLQDDGGRVPPPACDVSCEPVAACPRLRIVVEPVNDPPVYIPGPDITVCEDLADAQPAPVPPIFCYPNWAKRISAGADREGLTTGVEGQVVSFEVVDDPRQPHLFAAGPTVDPVTGTLCFELNKDRHGTAEVKITIVDSGPFEGPGQNGPGTGSNRGTSSFVRVTVERSNDPPTLNLFTGPTAGNPTGNPLKGCVQVSYDNDDANMARGAFSLEAFLRDVTRGGTARDEPNAQDFLAVEVEPLTAADRQKQSAHMLVPPRVDFTSGTTGRLSFTLRDAGKRAAETIFYRVRVRDSGGIEGSGNVRGSCGSQDYTDATACVTILPSSAPPAFSVSTERLCVPEDSPSNFFSLAQRTATRVPGFFLGLDPACERVELQVGSGGELFQIPPAAGQGSSSDMLTFTLQKDMYGDAEVYATAVDTCATPQTRSAPVRFVLCVQPCNDAPGFVIPSPNTLLTTVRECSATEAERHEKGCCEYFLPRFATGISPGPPNEAGQQLSFRVDPSGLPQNVFRVPPEVSRTGALSFCLLPDANTGVASLPFVLVDDGGNSGCNVNRKVVQVPFQVSPVNTRPTFIPGAPVVLNEDATCGPLVDTRSSPNGFVQCGVYTLDNWAGGMSPGSGTDEQVQRDLLAFVCTPRDLAIVSSCEVDPVSGRLVLNIVRHAFGQTSAEIVLTDGGVLNFASTPHTLPITILPVNDPPSFSDLGRVVTLFEDACYSSKWAAAASIGPANEAPQGIAYHVVPDANDGRPDAFFATVPRVDQNGVLVFCLQPDVEGSFNVVVTAQDTGGTARGGADVSAPHALQIRVLPVNDCPTVALSHEYNERVALTATEDQGEVVYTHLVLGVSPGPANERLQSTQLVAAAIPPEAFRTLPTFTRDSGASEEARGYTLRGVLSPNFHGTVSLELRAFDSGSGARPHCNASLPLKMVLVVAGVNDPPTFDLGPEVVTVEDAPGFVYPRWAQNVTAGPANERDQRLTFTVEVQTGRHLFAHPPVLDVTTGALKFELAKDQHGKAAILVCLTDSGAEATGGPKQKCTPSSITVLPQGDAVGFVLAAGRSTLDLTTTEDSGEVTVATWIVQGGEAGESAAAAAQYFTTASITVPTEAERMFAPGGSPVLVKNNRSHAFAPQTYGVRFTPAPDSFGRVGLLLSLGSRDSGAGLLFSGEKIPFSVIVEPVNDPPDFALLQTEVVVLEDGGPRSFLLLANTTAGPSEDGVQTVAFTIAAPSSLPGGHQQPWEKGGTVQAADLLVATLSPEGRLSVAPRPNLFGVFSLLATATDSEGASVSKPFVLFVLPVNDRPTFAAGSTEVVVQEDSRGYEFPMWATHVSPGDRGDALESTQAVAFGMRFVAAQAGPDAQLFEKMPAVAADTGTLTFTPAQDRYGTVLVDLFAFDRTAYDTAPDAEAVRAYTDAAVRAGIVGYPTRLSGRESATARLKIVVTPVNDPPDGMVPNSDSYNGTVRVREDAGDVVLPDVLRNVTAGGWGEDRSQHLQFSVETPDASLFLRQPTLTVAPGGAGSGGTRRDLSFSLRPNKNGETTLLLKITDPLGAASAATRRMRLNLVVEPVNDPPHFLSGVDVELTEDGAAGGVVRVPRWATEILAGPDDEASQRLVFAAKMGDAERGAIKDFAVDAATGDLRLTLYPEVHGVFAVNVTLTDDGGTLYGGVAESETRVFTLRITAVNDPPVFRQLVAFVSVPVNAAPHQVRWASGVEPGPVNERVKEGQTVAFQVSTASPRHFAAHGQPVSTPDGFLSFSVAGDRVGNVTLRIVARDSANALSKEALVHVNILPPHTAPSAVVHTTGPVDLAALQANIASTIGVPPQSVVLEKLGNTQAKVYFMSSPLVSAEEALRRFHSLSTDALSKIDILSRAENGTGSGVPPVAFTPAPTGPSPATLQADGGGGGSGTRAVLIGLIAGGVALVIAAAAAFGFWYRRRMLREEAAAEVKDEEGRRTPSSHTASSNDQLYPNPGGDAAGQQGNVYSTPVRMNPIEGTFVSPAPFSPPPVLG